MSIDVSDEKLAHLLIGSRLLRRARLRRLLLAHLLRERHEDEDEGEDYSEEHEGGDEEVRRLLIGSRLSRRARMRRALLAHLLRERREHEMEDEDEGEDDREEDEGGED